jgi:hypothetical protein
MVFFLVVFEYTERFGIRRNFDTVKAPDEPELLQ